jgi:hypothetical protein
VRPWWRSPNHTESDLKNLRGGEKRPRYWEGCDLQVATHLPVNPEPETDSVPTTCPSCVAGVWCPAASRGILFQRICLNPPVASEDRSRPRPASSHHLKSPALAEPSVAPQWTNVKPWIRGRHVHSNWVPETTEVRHCTGNPRNEQRAVHRPLMHLGLPICPPTPRPSLEIA